MRETADFKPRSGTKLTRMEASPVSAPDPVLRCALCNDAIGVYEPALVIENGRTRRTSLAREPLLPAARTTLIHGRCASEAGYSAP